MRGKIILLDKNKDWYGEEESSYSISCGLVNDYEIDIYIGQEERFEDAISKTDKLNEAIRDYIEYYEMEDELSETEQENYEILKSIHNREKEILDNAEYIQIDFSIEEIIKYIKNNPILKNKKIILDSDIIWNEKYFSLLKNELGDMLDNLYFSIKGNIDVVNYKDCLNTLNTIDEIVKHIEKYTFSPIETIMYVYDLVRNKVYKKEVEEENSTISRDLTNALLGDKIVCVGYANIFNKILEKLNINSHIYSLDDIDDPLSGHVRNVIYIKDDKYDIDGVYFFDATWDSKRNNDDTSFLRSYNYFAKTKEFFDKEDKQNNLFNKSLEYLSEELGEIVKKLLDKKQYDLVIRRYLSTINSMSSLVGKERIISNELFNSLIFEKDDIDTNMLCEKINEYLDYFDREIPCETLLKVLYNVRKYQYYENPDMYGFSLQEFYNIIIYSKWKFKYTLTGLESLIYDIILKENNRKKILQINSTNLRRYDKEFELSRDIERVKLAKTLRRVYENKKLK